MKSSLPKECGQQLARLLQSETGCAHPDQACQSYSKSLDIFAASRQKILFLSLNFNFIDFEAESVTQFYLPGGLGKRAWNSNFSGGFGKRAWNSGFTGEMTYHICNVTVLSSMLQTV